MASRVSDIGIWRTAGHKVARVEAQDPVVSGVSVEDAAYLVPAWGRIETRQAESRDLDVQMPFGPILGL